LSSQPYGRKVLCVQRDLRYDDVDSHLILKTESDNFLVITKCERSLDTLWYRLSSVDLYVVSEWTGKEQEGSGLNLIWKLYKNFSGDRGKPGETSVRIVSLSEFRTEHLSISIMTKLRFGRQETAVRISLGADQIWNPCKRLFNLGLKLFREE
jgi:hypothetical protein